MPQATVVMSQYPTIPFRNFSASVQYRQNGGHPITNCCLGSASSQWQLSPGRSAGTGRAGEPAQRQPSHGSTGTCPADQPSDRQPSHGSTGAAPSQEPPLRQPFHGSTGTGTENDPSERQLSHGSTGTGPTVELSDSRVATGAPVWQNPAERMRSARGSSEGLSQGALPRGRVSGAGPSLMETTSSRMARADTGGLMTDRASVGMGVGRVNSVVMKEEAYTSLPSHEGVARRSHSPPGGRSRGARHRAGRLTYSRGDRLWRLMRPAEGLERSRPDRTVTETCPEHGGAARNDSCSTPASPRVVVSEEQIRELATQRLLALGASPPPRV